MRAHVARPKALLAVITGCMLLFTLGRLLIDSDLRAADLSRTFAPTPLDLFGDLGLLDDSVFTWRTPLVFAIRIILVAVVLAIVLKVQLTKKAFSRLTLVYLGALASVVIPLRLSVEFLKWFNHNDPTVGGLGVIATLVLLPIVLTVLVVVWAPMAAQAIVGLRLRFTFNHRTIWFLAAASSWFYVFTSNRIEAMERASPSNLSPFMLALVVITLQSVIFGGLAFAAIEQPVELPHGSATS